MEECMLWEPRVELAAADKEREGRQCGLRSFHPGELLLDNPPHNFLALLSLTLLLSEDPGLLFSRAPGEFLDRSSQS